MRQRRHKRRTHRKARRQEPFHKERKSAQGAADERARGSERERKRKGRPTHRNLPLRDILLFRLIFCFFRRASTSLREAGRGGGVEELLV